MAAGLATCAPAAAAMVTSFSPEEAVTSFSLVEAGTSSCGAAETSFSLAAAAGTSSSGLLLDLVKPPLQLAAAQGRLRSFGPAAGRAGRRQRVFQALLAWAALAPPSLVGGLPQPPPPAAAPGTETLLAVAMACGTSALLWGV